MEGYRWGEQGLWNDVKALAAIAMRHITTQPLASHGDHTFPHIETETHPGQLFEGDTLDYTGEPTQPFDVAELQEYMHPFDHHPDRDTRQ